MSGYRQHSYDPNAYEQPGAPLKPFNWVQWVGVALQALGAALITVDLLARIGWIPRLFEDLAPAPFALLVIGLVLINSRREPATQLGPEQLARNRRTLLITVAICAVVFGAALIIDFSGA